MYNRSKSNENRQNLLRFSREYKKELNKSILVYKRKMRKKIRQMRQKSPNDYWNYINSLNNKQSIPGIRLDT